MTSEGLLHKDTIQFDGHELDVHYHENLGVIVLDKVTYAGTDRNYSVDMSRQDNIMSEQSISEKAQKYQEDLKKGKYDPVSAQLKAWDLMLGGLAEGDRLSRKLTLRKSQERKAKEVFERWYEDDKEWAERCGRTDPKGLARNAHFTGFFDGIEYRKDVSLVDEIINYAKTKESEFKESAIFFFKDRHKGNFKYCYDAVREYKMAAQIWYSVWRYIEIKYKN